MTVHSNTDISRDQMRAGVNDLRPGSTFIPGFMLDQISPLELGQELARRGAPIDPERFPGPGCLLYGYDLIKEEDEFKTGLIYSWKPIDGGWDTSTLDQILENLEDWKKRTQDQKGYLVDPRPLTVSPFRSWPDTPAAQAPEEKAVKRGQTRRGSLLESFVNLLVGYSINFTANLLIFPLFGWHISARENLTLGVIYTGISLVRSYGLRRLFNHKEFKK